MTLYIDLNAPTDGEGTASSPRNIIPTTSVIQANGNSIKFKRGTVATISYLNSQTESSVAYRYLGGSNCEISTYYNSDGTDDETQPKPRLTPIALEANTYSFFRFNSSGTNFTIKNIIFNSPKVTQVITCSNAGGTILVEGVEIYNHFFRYEGASETLTNNSIVLGSSAPVTKAIVKNCIIDGSADDNMVFNATNGIIENCIFKNPGQASPETIGDNISCSLAGNYWINHLVINNKFYLTHPSVKHCYLHNTSTGSGAGGVSTLIGNEFYLGDTSKSALPVSIGETDATGSSYTVNMYSNKIYGGRYMLFAVNGNINGNIFGNLFVTSVITPDSQSAVARIANKIKFCNNTLINTNGATKNTFYMALDQSAAGTDDATINQNNIFIGWPIAVMRNSAVTNSTEDYNCYYNNTKNVVRNGTLASISLGSNSITSNPNLDTSFKISDISPCFQTGKFISYFLDVERNSFNNPPSIGAYEYSNTRAIR